MPAEAPEPAHPPRADIVSDPSASCDYPPKLDPAGSIAMMYKLALTLLGETDCAAFFFGAKIKIDNSMIGTHQVHLANVDMIPGANCDGL